MNIPANKLSVRMKKLPASHRVQNLWHLSLFAGQPNKIKIVIKFQSIKFLRKDVMMIRIYMIHTVAPAPTGRRRVLAFKASMAPSNDNEWSLSK